MEEEAGVAVGALLELNCQIEILVIFTRSEVAVAKVFSVLCHKVTLFINTCAHASEQFPAVKILAVEEFDFLPGLVRKFLYLDIPE